jgi:hypothetical protein
VKEIESAARIRGIKKFAVGYSFWSATPPEYVRKRIAKAVELAELKGYKFVGGITTSDKPFGSNTPVNRSDQSSAFKRWFFIEFEETVTHPPETSENIYDFTKDWTSNKPEGASHDFKTIENSSGFWKRFFNAVSRYFK